MFEESSGKNINNRIGEEIQGVIDKMQEAKNKIEGTYKITSEEINKNWENIKLEIIPGDLLLDEVCKRYDIRFKKELGDGKRLASKMKPDEIPDELKKMIEEIIR